MYPFSYRKRTGIEFGAAMAMDTTIFCRRDFKQPPVLWGGSCSAPCSCRPLPLQEHAPHPGAHSWVRGCQLPYKESIRINPTRRIFLPTTSPVDQHGFTNLLGSSLVFVNEQLLWIARQETGNTKVENQTDGIKDCRLNVFSNLWFSVQVHLYLFC